MECETACCRQGSSRPQTRPQVPLDCAENTSKDTFTKANFRPHFVPHLCFACFRPIYQNTGTLCATPFDQDGFCSSHLVSQPLQWLAECRQALKIPSPWLPQKHAHPAPPTALAHRGSARIAQAAPREHDGEIYTKPTKTSRTVGG